MMMKSAANTYSLTKYVAIHPSPIEDLSETRLNPAQIVSNINDIIFMYWSRCRRELS